MSEQSLATDLLLRFIRNVFVHDSAIEGENWFHQYQLNEAAICCAINTLETCGTYSDMSVVAKRVSKMNNRLAGGNRQDTVERRAAKINHKLAHGKRRDTVKFVAKRLPCACLKKLHSAARKKLAKVGGCFGCVNQFPEFPISQLHVCLGCMISENCSRECQRAHLPSHKRGCGYPEVSDAETRPPTGLRLVESCFFL